MELDRRALLAITAGAAVLRPGQAGAQTAPPANGGALPAGLPQPHESIDLWPGPAPGMPANAPAEVVDERSTDPQLTDRALRNVRVPRMSVFRPLVPNGAAVLVTPGGGYKWVVIDKEGYEIGRWLSARGFTVFVLFYRLPGGGWAAGPDVALSDAQRAMRLIRHRAAEFAIDPERVAAMGFSAGGHLCADLATRWDAATYRPVDAADALSARPMLAAPIYPVVSMTAPVAHAGSRAELIGAGAGPEREAAHSPDRNARAGGPPAFIVHAEDDDAVPVENSLMLRAALRARGVPVETHLFTHGGHGFGLRRVAGKPAAAWPDLFLAWAKTQGLY
ncbi:alpha/beta hydrolase [Sphingomonas canadensis]|uniref:Alpha/beta hydrolase n=1 Tax=Sphingomonas canadensis TaxID=1219257 RepID=A0ABW3HAJ5_9SPHN|nr:alpha/beta hydrolase [Sphingomonas canadensis]MCW3837420.1 alpha/beta hydrolase [Sphingomonas canadensis]